VSGVTKYKGNGTGLGQIRKTWSGGRTGIDGKLERIAENSFY